MDINEKHAPKIRETTIRVKGREYPRVIVDFGTVDGKRTRKTFKTMRAAEQAVATWRAEQAILSRRIGEGAQRFLTGDVQDAAAALNILGPGVTLVEAAAMFNEIRNAGLDLQSVHDAAGAVEKLDGMASLTDAAKFYMDRHFPDGGNRKVDELVEDYIKSREDVDRRPATLTDIRARLGCAVPRNIERKGGGVLHLKPSGFASDFAGVPVSHVSTTDLEAWLAKASKGKAPSTRANLRVHLVGLFNFAMARKYVKENPAEKIITKSMSKSAKRRPYVMPVDDVEKVMRYASANASGAVPYFALALFAGIRPNGELSRLSWADIDFKRREIDIKAEVSKTGDERFVEMSDNLVAWLLPHRKTSGPIDTARAAVGRVRKKSGVRWAPDCMRHSFGSYHMGMHDNAGKTALQMGHRKIDTTFEHYRRAVRKEDATRFWEIRPEAEANVIEFQAKSA